MTARTGVEHPHIDARSRWRSSSSNESTPPLRSLSTHSSISSIVEQAPAARLTTFPGELRGAIGW